MRVSEGARLLSVATTERAEDAEEGTESEDVPGDTAEDTDGN